jgi:hypothetical protein
MTQPSSAMAKKRADVTVKISPGVYQQAKMVCAYRNESLAEYLTRLLEKPVSKDYAAVLRDLNAGSPDEGDKKTN